MNSSSGAIPKGHSKAKNLLESAEGETTDAPLDCKYFNCKTDGVVKRVPALHIGWIEKGTYVIYESPPLPGSDGTLPTGAVEAWLDRLDFMRNDLENLLSLPHHRFWSHVIYDEGIHECLESYLSAGPRWYIDEKYDEMVWQGINTIHNLVFCIYVRMATYKESKTHHITPEVFGAMIYDNYLFDICKLLDLCILYGSSNGPLLSKMISNIFMHQPKYYQDLTDTVSTVSMGLDKIEEQLGVNDEENPIRISHTEEATTLQGVHDIIIYLLDLFSTLHAFLTVFPQAANSFLGTGFEQRLAVFYERIVPKLMTDLSKRSSDPTEEHWVDQLIQKVNIVRSGMTGVFRIIVQHVCIQPLLDGRDCRNDSEVMEKYIQIMTTSAAERTFLADYCVTHNLDEDLKLLQSKGCDITSLNFIREAVDTLLEEKGLLNSMANFQLEEQKKEGPVPKADSTGMNGYMVGNDSMSEVEIASLVSGVQDLFGELGTGFVRKCLQYYNYSSEEVINALLEDNLPQSLASLDRSLADEEPKTKDDSEEEVKEIKESQTKVVTEEDYLDRANVYDADEFDVFRTKNIDHSRIHKGKKTRQIEPDKEHLQRIKEIARKYDETGGTSVYEDELRIPVSGLDYEDEYDDTYDDNEAGNIDEVGIDTNPKRLNMTPWSHITNNPNHKLRESEGEEEEEESTELEQARPKLGFKPFCENPEVLRQRAAERRATRRGGGGGWRGGSSGYGGGGGGGGGEHADSRSRGDDSSRGDMRGGARPKVSMKSNKSSGKSWRQGTTGDNDDNSRYHGGKYKESSGRSQNQQYKYKMMHKNDHRRHGAQAKFERNNRD